MKHNLANLTNDEEKIDEKGNKMNKRRKKKLTKKTNTKIFIHKMKHYLRLIK